MKTLLCTLFAVSLAVAPGQDPRSTDEPLTLHGYHPFRSMPESQPDWEQKQRSIRERVLVGSGLWPLPTKTPLEAAVHSEQVFDGYTISKVYFQSMPGHYVSGSLYQPVVEARTSNMPGVLAPHGHWQDARFYDLAEFSSDKAVREQIASGAERFVNAARNPIQARCVQLARMGCVVFLYDMIGSADSDQFLEHRRGPRPEMNGSEVGEWGFCSPMATAHLQTNFGLQTWNSVRALDFLTGLDGIDPDRLLVTGASGGATQTMILSAIDDRVDAAFPAVMTSTSMQGGCTCENTHYLRIGQGNVDIAAAIAPKPLGITAADDWTIELEEKGHPDLLALYKQLGAADRYEAHFDTHFRHNFNHVSRAHLYDFVNRHFGLGYDAPILERDFDYQNAEAMTVWNDEHPKPAITGVEHEKAILAWWHADAQSQFEAMSDGEASEVLKTALRVLIGREMPEAAGVAFELENKEDLGEALRISGTIRNVTHDETIPVAFRFPKNDAWDGSVVLDLTTDGTSAEWAADVTSAQMQIDLFNGENSPVEYPGKRRPDDSSWRKSPVYFYGYNPSVFARRVHDVMSAITMAQNHPDWPVKSILIRASEVETAAIGASAGVLSGVDVETGDAEVRFPVPDNLFAPEMLPGGKKYEALFRQP